MTCPIALPSSTALRAACRLESGHSGPCDFRLRATDPTESDDDDMDDTDDSIESPARPPAQPESGSKPPAPSLDARRLQLLALLDLSNLAHDVREVMTAIRSSAWPSAAVTLCDVAEECREIERVAMELVCVFEDLPDESEIPF